MDSVIARWFYKLAFYRQQLKTGVQHSLRAVVWFVRGASWGSLRVPRLGHCRSPSACVWCFFGALKPLPRNSLQKCLVPWPCVGVRGHSVAEQRKYSPVESWDICLGGKKTQGESGGGLEIPFGFQNWNRIFLLWFLQKWSVLFFILDKRMWISAAAV